MTLSIFKDFAQRVRTLRPHLTGFCSNIRFFRHARLAVLPVFAGLVVEGFRLHQGPVNEDAVRNAASIAAVVVGGGAGSGGSGAGASGAVASGACAGAVAVAAAAAAVVFAAVAVVRWLLLLPWLLL